MEVEVTRRERVNQVYSRLKTWAEENSVAPRSIARIFGVFDAMAAGEPQYRHSDQRPKFYVPDLSAEAWHDPADFEWVPNVERAAERIIAEYSNMRHTANLISHPDSAQLVDGSWSILRLFTFGKRNEQNCALIPEITQVIEGISTATSASLVYLSSLSPKTWIKPHYGPTNCRLRCHVGLKIPADCWIRVGSEVRKWKIGKCLVFDDSFWHEVGNESDERRDILIIDFWHPDLSRDEQRAMEFLTRSIYSEMGEAFLARAVR